MVGSRDDARSNFIWGVRENVPFGSLPKGNSRELFGGLFSDKTHTKSVPHGFEVIR